MSKTKIEKKKKPRNENRGQRENKFITDKNKDRKRGNARHHPPVGMPSPYYYM